MTGSRSTLPRLLAMSSFAAVLACGGEAGVTPTNDVGVVHEAASLTWAGPLTCPMPTAPGGFVPAVAPPGAAALPFAPVQALATVANPVIPVVNGVQTIRADLVPYILDLPTAIQLGKALFWDIQAGSDSKVACATCHFQAGADVRARNQLNPGPTSAFDPGTGLNWPLVNTMYPLNDPLVPASLANENITGSQGVRAQGYGGLSAAGAELNTAVTDPVFGTMRQVTGLNTPPTINAVFNHRAFFNARAQNEFNGVNPFGTRDAAATVWQVNPTTKAIQAVSIATDPTLKITNAALASQAVGPPLNTVEMSAGPSAAWPKGRTFPELGKKLLILKPLGLQTVSPTDGVLGGIASAKGKGLAKSYQQLIQKAFQPAWWNSAATVTVDGKPYTLMQANFSLYWGLSIMLYEATLVADQSPMDQYLASRTIGTDNLLPTFAYVMSDNPALLDPVVTRLAAEGITVTRDDILRGLDLFERLVPAAGTVGVPTVGDAVHPANRYCAAGSVACPNTTQGVPQPGGVGCGFCHVGAELTSASIRNITVGVEAGGGPAKDAGFDLRMERMFMGVRNPAPPVGVPPPPVPFNTTSIFYDSSVYSVTATAISNAAVTPQPVTVNTYDSGWYNVGVRPSADNLGVGGTDPFGKPLSWTEYLQVALPDPTVVKVPGGGLGCTDAIGNPITPPAAGAGSIFAGEVMDPGFGFPILFGPLVRGEKSDAAGSFKTSHLRNLELNGPYFHNGGKATLRQVVDLYDDGGNFANSSLSPFIHPLGLTQQHITSLVAYLVSLTDERVRFEKAPFDHPELPVPAGQDATGADVIQLVPAVGSAGRAAPVGRFLGLSPFAVQ